MEDVVLALNRYMACVATVGFGRKPESRRIELPPGRHNVELADGNANVEFLPGRLYRVETASFQAVHGTQVVISFIADTDSGETLECLTRSQGTEF